MIPDTSTYGVQNEHEFDDHEKNNDIATNTKPDVDVEEGDIAKKTDSSFYMACIILDKCT